MLCDFWDVVQNGPCQSLALQWDVPFRIDNARVGSFSKCLLAAIPQLGSPETWGDGICAEYREAASSLALAFALSDSNLYTFTTWDVLRVWPMQISEKVVHLLKEQHPSALILLAHYSLLLSQIDSRWYLGGRADRLLRSVTRKLHPCWHRYIPAATDDWCRPW